MTSYLYDYILQSQDNVACLAIMHLMLQMGLMNMIER